MSGPDVEGSEILARWSLDELDTLHALVGLGPEWLASDRRAALAALAEQVGRVASVGEGEECTCNPAEVENGVCVLCGKRFPVGDGV